jgi:hypothetical protein
MNMEKMNRNNINKKYEYKYNFIEIETRKIMEYAPTSHNRTVTAAGPSGPSALRLARSFHSHASLRAHLGGTKPCGFLYGAAQTSVTAGRYAPYSRFSGYICYSIIQQRKR